MEELLKELIAVNKEMLSELRMLRQSLSQNVQPAQQSQPLRETRPMAEVLGEVAPAFGQEEAGRTPPPRYTPKDLEDIRGSLMEGVKKRNKEKSDAFSEFQKRHKDW